MTSLQISSQSAKTGHGGHRLTGLSRVRDLHTAQETLHGLGVPRREGKGHFGWIKKLGITDFTLSTDDESIDKVWRDDTGEYKMEEVPREHVDRLVGKQAKNRKDPTQKRLLVKVDGRWKNWSGDGRESRANCARSNVNAMMMLNGRVCWVNFADMRIREAFLDRGGAKDDNRKSKMVCSLA
tara:strand:- start:282 stop:827 length:546 start_codon:yes stop_codon:yes gene_type:complete